MDSARPFLGGFGPFEVRDVKDALDFAVCFRNRVPLEGSFCCLFRNVDSDVAILDSKYVSLQQT